MPVSRKRILREWMGLTKLTDKSGDDDDRLECVREHDNKRHMEAVYSFLHALSDGHPRVARKIAKANDWERDMISDLLNWWLEIG